jgi:DNA-binding protein H-NS
MPKSNLASMSVDALIRLKADIENVLVTRADQLRRDLSKLSSHNKKAGGSPLKGRKVAVRYRDRAGNTWAGRGARPRWLVAAIKGGKKLDDFLIDKSARKGRRKRRSKR